jgi:hypothetical protein
MRMLQHNGVFFVMGGEYVQTQKDEEKTLKARWSEEGRTALRLALQDEGQTVWYVTPLAEHKALSKTVPRAIKAYPLLFCAAKALGQGLVILDVSSYGHTGFVGFVVDRSVPVAGSECVGTFQEVLDHVMNVAMGFDFPHVGDTAGANVRTDEFWALVHASLENEAFPAVRLGPLVSLKGAMALGAVALVVVGGGYGYMAWQAHLAALEEAERQRRAAALQLPPPPQVSEAELQARERYENALRSATQTLERYRTMPVFALNDVLRGFYWSQTRTWFSPQRWVCTSSGCVVEGHLNSDVNYTATLSDSARLALMAYQGQMIPWALPWSDPRTHPVPRCDLTTPATVVSLIRPLRLPSLTPSLIRVDGQPAYGLPEKNVARTWSLSWEGSLEALPLVLAHPMTRLSQMTLSPDPASRWPRARIEGVLVCLDKDPL